MSSEHTRDLSIFVIDEADQPVSDALVRVFTGDRLLGQVQSASQAVTTTAAPGGANAHMEMALPDSADVRVVVTHGDHTLEQHVDLDAPNLTFRIPSAPPPAPSSAPKPRRRTRSSDLESLQAAAPAISATALREAFLREFGRADLDLLSQDIDDRLRTAQPPGRFSLDDLPPGGLEYQVGELIEYFDRRQKLPLVLEACERARPGFRARAGLATPVPAATATPAATGRPVLVKPKIRLAEVPTSIYEMLHQEGWPLVSVDMTNQRDVIFSGSLTVGLQRFSDESILNVDLDPRGSATVPLHPVLNRDQIDELQEIERVTLHVRLDSIDNQTVSRQTESLYLLPRSAAPLSVKDLMTGQWRDLRPYLGGFVTPRADPVQAFLASVRRHVPGGQLVGYGGPPSAVEPQARAVYEALKELDVGYVHSTLVFNRHQRWASQRLRLPRETLEKKVANCLDGAVLFASVLEAVSIRTALVFTGTGDDAHAFVAWEALPDSGTWQYLETRGFVTATFDEARQEAEGKARAFEAEDGASGANVFARLAIRELRDRNINPLE